MASQAWGWELGLGYWVMEGVSARARPLLPECALVNKIYCEDARVSCSCWGREKGRGMVAWLGARSK